MSAASRDFVTRVIRQIKATALDGKVAEILFIALALELLVFAEDRSSCRYANPSTTRRVVALFFSIFVTTTAPISLVLATCVPPQG